MTRTLLLLLAHLLIYGVILVALAPGAGVWALWLGALLIWVSVHDIRTFEIPDTASALIVLGGALRVFLGGPPWADPLLGTFFWPLAFWLVGVAYLQARGLPGLGFGDVKLMAGIGLWCGLTGTVWVVLAASVSAALTLAATGRRQTQEMVAFGPFLCLCAWYVWVMGITG